MAFDMEDLLNMILEKGSTIALVACSNGQSRANDTKINSLIEYLEENSYKVKCSDFLYEKDSYFSGTGVERAMALMDAYKDENVSGIFDIFLVLLLCRYLCLCLIYNILITICNGTNRTSKLIILLCEILYLLLYRLCLLRCLF